MSQPRPWNPLYRGIAALLLASLVFSCNEADKALREQMEEKDWYRLQCEYTARGETVIAFLTEALRGPSARVRTFAAEAMGRIGSRDAVPALRRAMGDRNVDVRCAAAIALGRIGDPVPSGGGIRGGRL